MGEGWGEGDKHAITAPYDPPPLNILQPPHAGSSTGEGKPTFYCFVKVRYLTTNEMISIYHTYNRSP